MIVEVSNILLTTRKNTQNYGRRGKNKHGDPIFAVFECTIYGWHLLQAWKMSG